MLLFPLVLSSKLLTFSMTKLWISPCEYPDSVPTLYLARLEILFKENCCTFQNLIKHPRICNFNPFPKFINIYISNPHKKMLTLTKKKNADSTCCEHIPCEIHKNSHACLYKRGFTWWCKCCGVRRKMQCWNTCRRG